ncbi:MAG: hypothetical protein N2V71_03165 [Methanophagales archaeon]|nr:hypothetical protein [Methanophagales archaeon]
MFLKIRDLLLCITFYITKKSKNVLIFIFNIRNSGWQYKLKFRHIRLRIAKNLRKNGIKLTDDSRTVSGEIGNVFYLPDWEKLIPEVAQHVVNFSNMVNGTITGRVAVKYVKLNVSNYECPNWAIEIGEVSWDYGIPELINIAQCL